MPKDAEKVRVARPSILAPSKKLLNEFNERKEKLRRMGIDDVSAHNRAFDDIDYERKFRQEILNRPEALLKLRQIKESAKEKDIYLICYEKPPKKCHRFILIEIAKNELK